MSSLYELSSGWETNSFTEKLLRSTTPAEAQTTEEWDVLGECDLIHVPIINMQPDIVIPWPVNTDFGSSANGWITLGLSERRSELPLQNIFM
jgi:hypothetical protein